MLSVNVVSIWHKPFKIRFKIKCIHDNYIPTSLQIVYLPSLSIISLAFRHLPCLLQSQVVKVLLQLWRTLWQSEMLFLPYELSHKMHVLYQTHKLSPIPRFNKNLYYRMTEFCKKHIDSIIVYCIFRWVKLWFSTINILGSCQTCVDVGSVVDPAHEVPVCCAGFKSWGGSLLRSRRPQPTQLQRLPVRSSFLSKRKNGASDITSVWTKLQLK